jgi:hypothetical protein
MLCSALCSCARKLQGLRLQGHSWQAASDTLFLLCAAPGSGPTDKSHCAYTRQTGGRLVLCVLQPYSEHEAQAAFSRMLSHHKRNGW